MAGAVDLVLKWTLAVVYAAMGALIGAAFAYVTVKIVPSVVGATVLSVKAVQAIVIVAAVASALVATVGFVCQR